MPFGALRISNLVLLLLLFNNLLLIESTLTSSCIQTCQNQCVDRNIAFPLNAYELNWPNTTLSTCDFECHIAACRQGCTDLDESTCDSKCSSTNDLASCKQGCRAISDNFVHQIQLLINQVTIDADLDATQGIQLNWTFDQALELTIKEVAATNLKWFAQSRSTSGWKWTSMGAQAFRDSALFSTVYIPVGDLSADVWFRLAAVWRDNVITSQSFHQNFQSLPIKPNSPILSGSLQVTNNSWAVCWHSERQPSAETKPKFRLVLNTRSDGEPLRALETSANCHLLRNLPNDPNCCVLQVEDVSVDGEPTPNLRVPIELKPIKEKAEVKPFLVLTNGSTLIRVNDLDDYAMVLEPKQLAFMLPDERNITALSALSSNELLVGLSDGSIHLLDLNGENETTIQRELRPADDTPIIQIEVDNVQESLYFVRDTKEISRCWLRDCRNETRLETGSLQFIQTIALDSWNGNIYYATNNGDTSSTPLFPVTATDVYTLSITRRLAELPPVQTLQVDDAEQRLIAILRNGSIFSVDLVDKSVRDERDGIELSDTGYHGVKRSQMHGGRMFWLSSKCGDEDSKSNDEEGCLRSEELDELTQKVHLNTYIGGFGSHVYDFVLMKNAQKPVAMLPVSGTSLLLNSTRGQVTWKPPSHMLYQASSNWRLLEYECLVEEVRSDNLTQILRSKNLNATELSFPAESSRSYRASVRVCLHDGTCSEWSNATNSATSGDQINRLVVYVKSADNNLNKLTLLGEAFVDEKAPNLMDYLSSYLKDSKSLIDFDTQRRLLYLASARNGSILRFSADGSSTKLVDFLSTKHFALMSNQAVMFLASSFQIAAYRLTSSFQKIVYNCVESGCASVVGLATDLSTSTLYYLLKNGNGTVELHSLKFNSEEGQPQLLAITDKFPSVKQMIVVGNGRLAILTTDGHVGICDLRLGNLNLNNAIKDAQFLLLLGEQIDQTAQLKFENGIEFESADQAKLSWLTSPDLIDGQALYKVQLFQDGATGERTVDMTLDKTYTLPSAVLKKWCSKQKFDVQVDVVTAYTIETIKKASLIAPTKPPNPPENLKIYATQQSTVDGPRAMIDLFWDAPSEWNGDMLGYLVQCTVTGGEDAKTTMVANANLTAHQSLSYFFPTTSGRVSCSVASRNEQQLLGPFSESVSIDSSEFRPLVRLFAIDSTSSLLAIYNWSTVTPAPSTNTAETTKLRRTKRQTDSILYQSIAYTCNELYAVRKEADSTQPILVELDINNVTNVIHKVPLNGDFQQINAMTSDWVANRLLFVGNQDLMQISLENLQDQTALTPKQLLNLSVGAQDAKQLTFDPYTNTAYLLSKNGSLFSLNLNKKQEDNLGLHLDCLKSQTVVAIVTSFVWNKPASPTLYALTWNGMINIDPQSLKCSEVNIDWAQFGGKFINDDSTSSQNVKSTPEAHVLKSVTSFSVVDNFFVFVTATKLYVHDKTTGPITQIQILNPPLKQLLAASHSSQPYPERSCFTLPSPTKINFTVKNEDRTGAVIEVLNEAIIADNSKCPNISFPQTQYQIYFKRKDNEKIKNLQSVQRVTHIENGILDKETNYDVYISWFNRYYVPTAVSEIKHLRTGYGYPTEPQDPQAFALTPDTVLLYWKLPQTLNAPAAEIKYRIKQSNPNQLQPVSIGAKQFVNGNFSQDFSDIVGCLQNPCQAKIPNLRPSSDYQFWLIALHIQRINPQLPEDNTVMSTEAKVRTKDIPGTLRMELATSDSLLLKFTSLEPETAPREVYVRYRETILNHQAAVETSWMQAANSTFDPLANPQMNLTINELRSATSYDYQFVAYYGGSYQYDKENKTFAENYYQAVQQAKTKAGAPTQPEDVTLAQDSEGWYLKWKKPLDNGGLPLLTYSIEYRKNSTSDWAIADRGLPADQQPLRWRIDKKVVDDLKLVEFRVRAYNAEGFGASGYSEPQHDPNEQNMSNDLWVWLIATLALIGFLLITSCMALFIVAKSRKHKEELRRLEINKPICLEQFNQIQFYESAELPLEIQNEIRNLPKIPRRNIIIEKELGKGSFGIVSKGVVQDWEPLGQKSVTVAIKQMKTCQKGQGRSYFLKEAVVMNNFDHPNIVRLLGVCLDDCGDQSLLIMEYMSGGDLHAFLRSCRRNSLEPSIRMIDLLSMMIDVCRAAAYLEANKHVHRDLAARNCLISSKRSQNRVTKISDFGMAREVYQSDYYRLNGEDLLPLRWLSPEAAHEGLFTSKSDVWAFGVLVFEIISLGEKPYSNFDNSLVLHKLKSGQNPGRPTNCPDEIFHILEQTWLRDAKERPSFSQILPQLEKLRGSSTLQSIDPLARREFISYENNGFDNSTGSNSSRSDTAHFNKSDTRSRGHQMPQSMRRRQSNQMIDTDSYRGDSIASAETFMTSTGDYETPRSASIQGTPGYTVGYQSFGSASTQRPFFYNNDAFQHERDLNGSGNLIGENNTYEMLNQSAPSGFRHRPQPLTNIPSAPNLHPPTLATPPAIDSYICDSPRRRDKLVSRV